MQIDLEKLKHQYLNAIESGDQTRIEVIQCHIKWLKGVALVIPPFKNDAKDLDTACMKALDEKAAIKKSLGSVASKTCKIQFKI